MKKFLIAGCIFLISSFAFSEDIELYISESIKQTKTRPQVLIVFDNSGSMGTREWVKQSYNPSTNYVAVHPYTKKSGQHIYYNKGQGDISDIPIADDPNEKRTFPLSISNCKVAQDIIDKYGFYTGHVREYKFQGNSGRWTELNEKDGSGIVITDCEDDVLGNNSSNKKYLKNGTLTSLPSGYPIDGEGDSSNPEHYTGNINNSNVEWTGSLVTLYSDNYLRWYHNSQISLVRKSRIDIAKESVTNLIQSSPNVDFGLETFNRSEGGRIVFGITESTLNSRIDILNIINNNLDAENWTPLCETLYEASRYFAGKSVDYGDVHSNPSPQRDKSIEKTGKIYKSPFSSCSDKAYVIIITDGEPTQDSGANTKVKNIPQAGQDPMGNAFNGNYLAALAGWMNNNDVNSSVDGIQNVSTYTIGFGKDAQSDAEPLLKKTAELGGGKYFPAQDTASLTAALTNVLANLEPSNNSLTSSSVAADNFDRTETLDSVYYSMFQPDRGPRWQGNVKKYKVEGEKLVGKNKKIAIDPITGQFTQNVKSYWSTNVDGNKVVDGGVAEMLRQKTNRVIYSDIKGALGDSLDLFTYNKLTSSANFFKSRSVLATKLDVDEIDVENYVKWARGIDVDDEDDDGKTTDIRYDVFGDPLHSKPLVINYGDKIHLVVGTNAGALHMFKDDAATDTVDETWAFMPKEFLPNIKKLRNNSTSDDKVYGVDGAITSYIDDKNGDGIIDKDVDTVWIFFGLRRGGSSYYALDISNPDSPKLMWHIKGGTVGFQELGQTWSKPKIGFSKLNIVNNIAKPSLFFGGGYDPSKDNKGVGAPDNIGRSVYMVDAETGTLKWSMAKTNAYTVFDGEDSIPSGIAILDSDSDGLIDRLYTGDTGGFVWRVDMPSDSKTDISVFKLADLGGNTLATDRRFFYEPAIVRTFITETIEAQYTDSASNTSKVTVHQEVPYDAILLGSGNRSNPLGTSTDDMFFMIKDKNIITQTFFASGTPTKPSALSVNDLYDYTQDPFGSTTDEGDLQDLSLDVSKKSGWFVNLVQNGEKSTAEALVINNTVFFTTYTPPDFSQQQVGCALPSGQAWLYGIDLALGIKKFNWDQEFSGTRGGGKILPITNQFIGAPTMIVLKFDDGDSSTIDVSKGYIDVSGKLIDANYTINTLRSYLYVTEDQ